MCNTVSAVQPASNECREFCWTIVRPTKDVRHALLKFGRNFRLTAATMGGVIFTAFAAYV